MTEPISPEAIGLGKSQVADQVPFFLRAWWMRDYKAPPEILWQMPNWLTLPLFSLQSDPFCDAGNIDFDMR